MNKGWIGFIIRHQGRDSFVSRKEKLVWFSDIELFTISNDQVQVLSIARGNDPHYLNKLELPALAFYDCIRHLRKTKKLHISISKLICPNNMWILILKNCVITISAVSALNKTTIST